VSVLVNVFGKGGHFLGVHFCNCLDVISALQGNLKQDNAEIAHSSVFSIAIDCTTCISA
jgi:hypothetical protein